MASPAGLAPHAKIRPKIVPQPVPAPPNPPQTPPRPKRAKRWAELLARVFGIDMSACPVCRGPLKIIAAILEPHAIKNFLTYLKLPDKPPGQSGQLRITALQSKYDHDNMTIVSQENINDYSSRRL